MFDGVWSPNISRLVRAKCLMTFKLYSTRPNTIKQDQTAPIKVAKRKNDWSTNNVWWCLVTKHFSFAQALIFRCIYWLRNHKCLVVFTACVRDLGPLHMSPVNSGQPGWPRLATLSFVKFRCVHTRSRAGPVTEIPVFATEISVTLLKIFPYEHSSPGNREQNF